MKLFILLCLAICFCDGSSEVDSYSDLITFVDNQSHNGFIGGIVHPCVNKSLECIRRFFAKHSDCSPRHGPAPDPFIINHIELPMPHANMTFIEDDVRLKGLNDVEIKEFYINQATGKLVLHIIFKELVLTVPSATFRHHIEGREPVELSDYLNLTNKYVSMTMVVPISDHGIQISKSQVYTTVDIKNSSIKFGPGLVSKDPTLRTSFDTLTQSSLNISLKEGYIVKGPIYMAVFIENNVCSFR